VCRVVCISLSSAVTSFFAIIWLCHRMFLCLFGLYDYEQEIEVSLVVV